MDEKCMDCNKRPVEYITPKHLCEECWYRWWNMTPYGKACQKRDELKNKLDMLDEVRRYLQDEYSKAQMLAMNLDEHSEAKCKLWLEKFGEIIPLVEGVTNHKDSAIIEKNPQ